MARDSQRSKVYAGEQMVRTILNHASLQGHVTVESHGSHLTVFPDRRFGQVQDVQSYVDRVLSLNWVRATWEQAYIPVKVRTRQGQAKAHYEPWNSTIALPPFEHGRAWALREIVVLHELAHHLSRGHGHDEIFAGTFVALVEEIIGSEVALLLRTGILEQGARVQPFHIRTSIGA
jgi:putative metallohydrolase (TIGR04338 family)